MNSARHQFLTGSTLTLDQDGAGRRCHGAHGLLQLLHCGTGSNDVVQRISCGGITAQRKILFAEDQLLQRALHRQLDLVHQSRTLTDVIRRSPGLHRLYRSLIVIHRCDQNDGGVRRNAVRVAQHLDAINIRHFDVGDNDVVQSAVYFVFCALP